MSELEKVAIDLVHFPQLPTDRREAVLEQSERLLQSLEEGRGEWLRLKSQRDRAIAFRDGLVRG